MQWSSVFTHCEQPALEGLLLVAARSEACRWAAGETILMKRTGLTVDSQDAKGIWREQ